MLRLTYSRFLFVLLLGLAACGEPTLEESYEELIIGTWECNVIVASDRNYVPEKDSALFFINGNRQQISFSSRGTINETGFKFGSAEYYIQDEYLFMIRDEDTLLNQIVFLNHNKLIIADNDKKSYYQKFKY